MVDAQIDPFDSLNNNHSQIELKRVFLASPATTVSVATFKVLVNYVDSTADFESNLCNLFLNRACKIIIMITALLNNNQIATAVPFQSTPNYNEFSHHHSWLLFARRQTKPTGTVLFNNLLKGI